jgi:hypothetical protein
MKSFVLEFFIAARFANLGRFTASVSIRQSRPIDQDDMLDNGLHQLVQC